MENVLLGKKALNFILLLFSLLIFVNAQPKGYIYEESKVVNYSLPDPLICNDGKKVENKNLWDEKRRNEILRLFKDDVYGNSPQQPFRTDFKVIEKETSALGGNATRRQVVIKVSNANRSLDINLLIYSPNGVKSPVPAFLTINFHGNHTVNSDPEIKITQSWVRNRNGIKNNRAREMDRGISSSRWSINQIIESGYAFATFYYGDVDPDFHDGFKNGVHGLFETEIKTKRKDTDWGSIAAWAWGLSRCMDYIQEDSLFDHKQIAVMGHSRLGKTALWAGAIDERFALIISNNSGCGGAALSRRRFGETVKRINTSFPHWFCENYKKYNENEEKCPVDQHMLISLAAPRPVYIASAEGDLWADPKGEFLSAIGAEPVYKLFGYGLGATEQPSVNEPVHGRIGYHIRSGKHDVTEYDWEQYLKFADKHFE